MKFNFLRTIIFLFGILNSEMAFSQSKDSLIAFSRETKNATRLIQQKIDSISNAGGGVLRLPAGEFLVDSIKLGIKTSIIGAGIGSTIIRQTDTSHSPCVIVSTVTAGMEISALTITGNNDNAGIYVQHCVGDGENHNYVYTKFGEWDKKQAYKWINIHDIAVYNFDVGLLIEPWGFNLNISNSTFGMNGDGVIMRNTDSSIYNCYINNNRRNGLRIVGGNNKISNVKSIFNGRENGAKYAAVLLEGSRCQLVNVETQDNFCKGFHVTGTQNLLANCISNTDGYAKNVEPYSDSVNGYGFCISAKENMFSNCLVTTYTDKYGAVLNTPVFVDEKVAYDYPGILNDIHVFNGTGHPFFHNPMTTSLNGSSKNEVKEADVSEYKELGRFFRVSDKKRSFIMQRENYDLEHLNIVADFLVPNKVDQYARIFSLGTEGNVLELVLTNEQRSFLVLYCPKLLHCSLELDENEWLVGQVARVMCRFRKISGKCYAEVSAYVKYKDKRGWMKKVATKEISQEAMDKLATAQSVIELGKDAWSGMYIKRLVASYSPIPESYLMPGSDLSPLFTQSFVYVDADSYKANPFKISGKSVERPKLTVHDCGYMFFDELLGMPIWWNGSAWVNSLGKVVK